MNQVYRNIEDHIPHLRRYARHLAHSPAAADDLVQDCLARALAKAHLFRPGTNLRAWLFTILRNQHISDMRRQGRRGTAVDPDDVAEALATRPDQHARLVVAALDEAMRRLPRPQRALIRMVALQGRSYEEAAEAMGLPVGTVKSRLSRSRRQLRRMLDGRPARRRGPRPSRGERGRPALQASSGGRSGVSGGTSGGGGRWSGSSPGTGTSRRGGSFTGTGGGRRVGTRPAARFG